MLEGLARNDDFAGEYDATFDPDAEIRQGDVLELLPGAEPEAWSSHLGIVLTANCDLVYRKHGGVLSYVPVVPVEVYARAILLPRLIEAEIERSERHLSEAVPVEDGWPSLGRLTEMLELGERIETVCEALPNHPDTEVVAIRIERLSAALDCQRTYTDEADTTAAIALVEGLLHRLRAIDGHKPQPPWHALGREVHNRLTKSLPGDSIFIDRVSPDHREGYIAYLRLIREIQHDSIARSAVEEQRLGARVAARRVGRLGLLYLHRLTQQLVKVFADIGRPTDYETNWERAVDTRVKTWGENVVVPNPRERTPPAMEQT